MLQKPSVINVQNLNKLHYSRSKEVNIENSHSKEIDISNWECSKEYEKVMKTIGRNRKHITDTLEALKASNTLITFEKVKEILETILGKVGIHLSSDQWYSLLNFAEKDKIIDYKLLLETFKQRLYLLSAHPKAYSEI